MGRLGMFQFATSVVVPGVGEFMSPLRTDSQITIAYGITIAIWMKALLAFKSRYFEAHLSGERLKCWGAICGVQTLHPSEFPPSCMSPHQGWGLW